MAEAKRDQNRVTGLLLEDDVTGLPVPALRDSLGRLKVVGVISGGGGAPTDATYVTLSTNVTLTNERVLTGTANQVIITDNGAGSTVVLSTPQDIGTASSPTFASLTATTSILLEETGAGTDKITIQAPALIAAAYTLTLPVDDGTSGQVLTTDGSGVLSWSTNGAGDVVGPGSATDNAIARYDGTTGKLIQNSGVLIDDSNNITGAVSLAVSSFVTLEETGAGTDTIKLQAPSSIGAAYTLTLPVDDGTANQVLATDGSGVLSWVTNPAGSAPVGATYVTLSTDSTLTNERVLTAGSQITITDAGAGSTITIASPFYFDATVGATGADYTTVKGAIDAGKKRILAIANTTEVASTAIPATGFYLYIPLGITIAMGNFAFTSASAYDVCIEGKGIITYAHSSAVPLIGGIGAAQITLRGLAIINTSSVDETPVVASGATSRLSELRIVAANKIHGGIYSVNNDCSYDNITILGGGPACARAFESAPGGVISNIKFEGEFITGASTDDTSIFKTQTANMSNVVFEGLNNPADVIMNTGAATNFTALACEVHYRIADSQISNFEDESSGLTTITFTGGGNSVNGVSMENGTFTVGNTDDNVISNIWYMATLDLSNTGGSNNRFVNCVAEGAVSIAQDRCQFTNCSFLGGATVTTNGDNNGFSNCQFGADAGGGALTLTIDAGADNTRVVGCMTDAAISDAGTGTVTAANVVY